ncbi:MAG: hypothetical protein CMK07_07180 [Ponticaulis sp.]|nr:hypothetical protein [Ponticaulis sp.]
MKQFLFSLIILWCAPLQAAHAHPRKEANIEVSFNERTQVTEVVHRYRIIDAEDLIQALYEPTLSIKEDAEAQALFGDYISERFSLRHGGKTVDLELVGGEIDDGYVWIYQTADALPQEELYVMRATALMDVHSDQVNIVNVRLYDDTQTFIFSRSTPFVTFRLDGESVY